MITSETRRDSHNQTDKSSRYKLILDTYKRHGAMTAREVGRRLGFSDLNAVKPRITELCERGQLEAIGKKFDPTTNRHVALFAIPEEDAKKEHPALEGATGCSIE